MKRQTLRRLALWGLTLLLILPLCACGGRETRGTSEPEPSPGPAVSADMANAVAFTGADGTLRALVLPELLSAGQEGQLHLNYRAANRSGLALTRLRFTLDCYDSAGQLLREGLAVTVEWMEDPLAPGQTRELRRTHFFTGAEKTASVVLRPVSAEDETELAPWLAPRENSLLPEFCNDAVLSGRFAALESDPPVRMRYQEDQIRELESDDPALIREVLEALGQVKIGGLSERNVDDGGFTYTFYMADGSSWSLRFDFKTLFFWHGRNYEVLDASQLLELELPES